MDQHSTIVEIVAKIQAARGRSEPYGVSARDASRACPATYPTPCSARAALLAAAQAGALVLRNNDAASFDQYWIVGTDFDAIGTDIHWYAICYFDNDLRTRRSMMESYRRVVEQHDALFRALADR